MFDSYKVNEDNVAEFVTEDGRNFFTVKYAGATNRDYTNEMGKIQKKYGNRLNNGRVKDEEARSMLVNVFMRTLLVDWGHYDDSEAKVSKSFIDRKGTKEYPETKVEHLLNETVLLFQDIFAFAQNRENFVDLPDVEDTAGN